MRREKTIILLVVLLVVLLIVLMTGIGYAAETSDALKINDKPLLLSEQSDFKIEFTGEPTYKGKGVAKLKLTGPTSATMNITELNSVGDSVTVRFTIANKSSDLNADIYTKVTNTNTEYFKVTSTLSESTMKPKTGKTILEITVELIKLPIDREQKANIGINISANPRYYD